MSIPEISIIIPTHNRAAQLIALLDSLAAQTYPMHKAEVIVVADSCNDDTEAQVTRARVGKPFLLHYMQHTARNPGTTRNVGAFAAQGAMLLFIDDDMVALPTFIQAHVDAQGDNRVVIGYSHCVLPQNPSRNQLDARLWWEQRFAEMQCPDHRFSYTDFFSGNVSMPTALFRAVKGFDSAFAGRLEDYELGLRLIKTGAQLHFCIQAQADHHDANDLPQWLRRRRAEGSAEIMIAERHPETHATLEQTYSSEQTLRYRMLRKLAWHGILDGWPQKLALTLIHHMETYNLRYRRGHLVYALSRYQYWRGQADRFPSQATFQRWLTIPKPVIRPIKIDIRDVLRNTVSENTLNLASEQGVVVVLDGIELLTQPPTSTQERLQNRHLQNAFRSWLHSPAAARLNWFLVEALDLPGIAQTFSSKVSNAAVPISVVVCTRDRPEQLIRCLAALQKQDYPNFEVVIVDNASSNPEVERIIRQSGFRYIREERPGLNWARNCGWKAARHELIAFTDDDAQAEPDWLRWVVHAFEHADVDGMTGLVEPLEQETEAQRLFEIYGGMSKGKQPRRIMGAYLEARDLLSAHNCGVGANMAFRRKTLQHLDGFDTALDTGTISGGAGDIDMFHRVLVSHMIIRYQPSAIVYHEHRRTMQALEHQIEQNGRSFGVYLLKALTQRSVPRRAVTRYAAGWFGAWLLGNVARGMVGMLAIPRSLAIAELRGALDAPRAFRATYAQDRAIRERSKISEQRAEKQRQAHMPRFQDRDQGSAIRDQASQDEAHIT